MSEHAELIEWLDSPDLEDDIANRPITEIITDICRALGLGVEALAGTQRWKRCTHTTSERSPPASSL